MKNVLLVLTLFTLGFWGVANATDTNQDANGTESTTMEASDLKALQEIDSSKEAVEDAQNEVKSEVEKS